MCSERVFRLSTLLGLPGMSPQCPLLGENEKRDARRERVSQAVTLARGGRHARFSDKSHLDRIRDERVTPLVQRPREIRLGVDCSTFALAPFSSVGIERKVSHVVVAGLFPMFDRQRLMLRRDASNERLQKINPAALWGEAPEMECLLLAPLRHAEGHRERLLIGIDRK
jgi:hypothetical protein